MSSRAVVHITLASLAVLLCQAPIRGQSHDGVVLVRVEPSIAEPLRILGPPSYRIYDEPTALSVSVSFWNESAQRVVLDQAMAQKALRIRLHRIAEQPGQRADEIPVVMDWLPVVQLADERAPMLNTLMPLVVEPHEGVGWTVELRQLELPSQPLPRGSYSLDFEWFDLHRAVQNPDLSPWVGRSPTSGRSRPISVILQSPSTPRERAMMHRLVGDDAMRRAAYQEAIEPYSKAVAADPTDNSAKHRLGSMLVALGRYAEAIPLFEQLFQNIVPTGDPSWVAVLARAYLGVGNEQKAIQVLRRAGLPDDQIATKVSDLQRVNRLQAGSGAGR